MPTHRPMPHPDECCKLQKVAAGEWRGLEVAIKTVIFSSGGADQQMAQVSSEAAIASNLSHRSIVATYSHDILDVQKAVGPEFGVYKFYLIQVAPAQRTSENCIVCFMPVCLFLPLRVCSMQQAWLCLLGGCVVRTEGDIEMCALRACPPFWMLTSSVVATGVLQRRDRAQPPHQRRVRPD